LRSARTRRETYFGPWLPEPLLDDRADLAANVADAAETADSLTMAFLVVLETLTPLERAVFVLHDVFGYEYGEVAAVVQKSETNCRQLASRARRRVHEDAALRGVTRATRGWRPASSQPAKGVTSMNWSTCSLVTPPSTAMVARRELG
jgi:DNA-directed RNA polymerase specialized sigma24 family protein